MVTLCPSAKPHEDTSLDQDNNKHLKSEEEEKDNHNDLDQIEEEEDPYNLCMEDIYDTVDVNSTVNPTILNRPPAPVPRPECESRPDKPATYIARGSAQSTFLSPTIFFYTSDFIKLISMQKWITEYFWQYFQIKVQPRVKTWRWDMLQVKNSLNCWKVCFVVIYISNPGNIAKNLFSFDFVKH